MVYGMGNRVYDYQHCFTPQATLALGASNTLVFVTN